MTTMEKGPHCAEHTYDLDFIRPWVCINESFPPQATRHHSPNSDDSISSEGDHSYMASKHRPSVLEAATRFAAGRKRPSRKRKGDLETSKAHKKLRLKTTKKSSTLFNMLSSATNDRLLEKSQSHKPIHEAVERYLQPIQNSRLNKIPSRNTSLISPQSNLPIPSTVYKDQTCAMQDMSAASTTSSDTENYRSASTLCRTAMPDLQASEKNQSYDDMFIDIEDSFFEDDLFLQDVVNSQNSTILRPQLPTPPHSRDGENTKSEKLLVTDNKVQLPMSKFLVPPFLRTTLADPIPAIKYSPIPRLVSSLRVPTCFRIAEALRLYKSNPSTGRPISQLTIELYAKVVEVSVTSNETQQLRLADIFFARHPPFITGTYTGPALGNTSTDNDTIYRVIVRSPVTCGHSQLLNGNGSGSLSGLVYHHVQIQAIREASWAEIVYVRGIVDPEDVELEKNRRQESQVENDTAMATDL